MNKQQPDALRLAAMLTADEWPGSVTLVSYARECVAELLRQHARITALESQLAQRFDAADMATAAAQGFRDGVASLSANAGEPFGWVKQSEIDSSKQLGGSINLWRKRYDCDVPIYLAAPPTAQAEGWQSIETAPKEGVFLVYMQDEVRPARRMQVANWHPNVKIVGGLFAFDCAKGTHWMPLPPPPTSAKGVEHG